MSRPIILCVDDEPIVLESLKEQFRRQFDGRYQIEVAEDAAEALELIAELEREGHELPVIVSDHIMPGMKGDALLIEVHARLPRTRKILLTGQAGVDAVGHVVNHGALYRYISKPWDREDLALTIQEALRSYYQEQQVERQTQALLRAHAAARRFVPFEFLRLLGRERLDEVSLQDHTEQRMSVFFSDIRSYTSLVEGSSPKETFDFVNEYLGHMEPAIVDEGGFIDSLLGDGIMALFEGSPDRAVRAGIASVRALGRFNDILMARGARPIRVGIGINTGPLMLGIRGGRERLAAGVLGDPVNIAARLESFTKQVGATMVVSESTVEALDDPAAFSLRPVDRVRLKGKARPVLVYEVLDALPEVERTWKQGSQGALAAARAEMLEGKFAQAAARLETAQAVAPDDVVIARCLGQCRTFIDRGGTVGWDGVTDLDEK